MTTLVSLREARAQLSRLIDQAHAGQEIILTKRGKPVARLMPLRSGPVLRQPGGLNGQVDEAFFEPLPEAELAAWYPR